MVKCKFEYTGEMLKSISKRATKNISIFMEIAMIAILAASVVLFVVGQTMIGVVGVAVLVAFGVSLYFINRSVISSNAVLAGQEVNVEFKDKEMHMEGKMGDAVLYNANLEYNAIKKLKQDNQFIYIFFDKTSVVTIPKICFKSSNDMDKVLHLLGNDYQV